MRRGRGRKREGERERERERERETIEGVKEIERDTHPFPNWARTPSQME